MPDNLRRGAQTLSTYFSRKSISARWRANAPFYLFAIKSALAVACSWEVASLLIGKEAASLAPVSAVIIVQVTSWQTARKSIERILGIIIGVILALLTIHLLGVSFWTILLLILSAQIVALFVQKRGAYLATQIPISAVLVFVVSTNQIDYPLLRLLGALIGGLVGTVISLLLSPPVYITRARESLAELTSQIATATTPLADALTGNTDEKQNKAIYKHMQALEEQVREAQQALSLGFDSLRLNPWARTAHAQLTDYPEVLTAINRIVRQLRRIAYTINDSLLPWRTLAHGQEWAEVDAQLLRTSSEILVWVSHALSTIDDTQENDTRPVNSKRKEELIATLETAQQLLISNEDALRHMNTQELPAIQEEQNPPGKGYHLSLRGTILTDLRRILQELGEILALLP